MNVKTITYSLKKTKKLHKKSFVSIFKRNVIKLNKKQVTVTRRELGDELQLSLLLQHPREISDFLK